MGKFDELTVFIEKLENDDPGYRAEVKGSGTSEDPYVLGYPVLSETARDFIKAFYHFEHEHPEYDLKNYLSYTDEHDPGGLADTDKMYKLLASDGMLVKRPLLVADDAVLTGFKEADWKAVL